MIMYLITTQCYEDYGYRVKPKGGRNIIVEGDLNDAYAVAELIRDEMEHILGIEPVDAGNIAEEQLAKAEMEIYEPVRYLDPVVRKNGKGEYFLKRGYVVNETEDRPEYKHLAGKFCGWVDNLTTGSCVMAIEGDKRTMLEA